MIRGIKHWAEKQLFYQHWSNQKYLKENNLLARFNDEILQTNLFRLKIAIAFSLVFLITQFIANKFIETPWSEIENQLFLYLDLSIFIILSFIGFILYLTEKNSPHLDNIRKILPKTTLLIIFIWGALVSNIECRQFEYFPTYSLLVIVFSMYFIVKGSTLFFFLLIGFIALINGHHLLPTIEKQPYNYYQIVFAATFISWIVSRILYHNREQIFIEGNKLEMANQSLERRVEERTNELSEINKKLHAEVHQRKKYAKSLMIAKQKAEESDQLKSAFLANMSHEIRTPMNGIIGFSGLLQKRNLPQEKIDKYLNMIQNNCKQLLVIIDDILDLSKIEANQIKLNETSISSNEILDEVIEIFTQYKKHIKKDHISLSIEKNNLSEPLYFLGDLNRIQQVLYNFMRNALKFTKKGNITLGITKNPDEIVFYVADTGIGIPKNKQPHIFDRFYQADNSEIRSHSGAGLGLSISRGLAELMSGKIWFESEEFKGTTFYLSLPYKSSPVEKTGYGSSRATTIENTAAISKKNILIVEDEYTSYLVLKEMMLMYNANVSHAINGKEALELFEKGHLPDLVLMDIQLPEMDGYQTTNQIKKRYPQVPVVAQTASINIRETDTSMFDAVVLKPINEKILVSELVRIFTIEEKPNLP